MNENLADTTSETFPHSAASTWSGFIYQGKVAICHAISVLLDNYSEKKYLQLDSLEDFSILDSLRAPISLHQVKALKCSNWGTYSSEIDKLNRKANLCTKLFFHTAKGIEGKTKEEIYAIYPNVKIYKYPNEVFYCPVDEIDKKIETKCKEIYEKYYPSEDYKRIEEYCKRTRECFDQIVLEKVINIHQKNHDNQGSLNQLAFQETIPLDEFKNICNCSRG